MFRKLGHVLLIVALLAAVGGHWAVLQTIAWSRMLAENLRTDCVAEAVGKTFDGNHPCRLCKAIAAGKKSEKKIEFQSPFKKLEFAAQPEEFVFCAPPNFYSLPSVENRISSRTTEPSVPPPRDFFA